ncbi:hypothetical protein KAX97_06295 [candidate division WOR-3 bacterium]|nr:hypothetical protein [candidate division WOR-3 bacterium]
MVSAIFLVGLLKNRDTYICLAEVIPEARIISQEDGIIEYKGIQYILGVNDLKKRKHLIESLRLLDLESPCIVDLRFDTQIIIKNGPGSKKYNQGSKNVQSRRN